MAVVSVRKLSELGGARRIDAEYYQPEYLRLVHKLRNLGAAPLEYFCYFVKKGIFDLSPRYYVDSGVPFVRTTEIKSEIADFSSAVFLSEDTHSGHTETELESGDIVFTKIGANIGDSAILPPKYPRYNFSQNVAGAKIRTTMISPYYLAAYLSSNYGRVQLKRVQMPSGQGKLELIDIKKILIFIADSKFQKHTEEIYRRAEDKVRQSAELYFEAENLLLEELGLKDFKPKYELSYTANLSQAFGAHRVDAEYFQPAYEALLKKIEVFEFSKLGQIAERVLAKVKPDPAQIYKYIEISDIAVAIGETNYTERLGKELPPNARIPINGGELIISKVRPTRGAISIIPKELDTSVICSSAFSVFRTESPLKEYLYMVSRSVVGRLQMERPTTGTSYPTIRDNDVENMQIPLLSNETQQEIASLVQQTHEARTKAKELLEEAKRKVEQMIETASTGND